MGAQMSYQKRFLLANVVAVLLCASAHGQIFENFDGAGNTNYSLLNSSGSPPSIAGGFDQFVVLTNLDNSNNNTIAFDLQPLQTGAAPYGWDLEFDFRMTDDAASEAAGGGGSAGDGFGIGLFPTSLYGVSGPVNPATMGVGSQDWERPSFDGAFTVGFDVYPNIDFVSANFDNVGIAAQQLSGFDLNDGQFHSAHVSARPLGDVMTLEMTIDGLPVFPSATIASELSLLTQADYRLIAGGRTGDAFVRTSLDNIRLTNAPAPEPEAPQCPSTPTAIVDVNYGGISVCAGDDPLGFIEIEANAPMTFTNVIVPGGLQPGDVVTDTLIQLSRPGSKANGVTGLAFYVHYDEGGVAAINNLPEFVWPIEPSFKEVGDFNENGILDTGDVDLLSQRLGTAGSGFRGLDGRFDIASPSESIDEKDLEHWIFDIKETFLGDVNLDGIFGTTDLVMVAQEGKYDTNPSDNVAMFATYTQGDWTGDNKFDSSDFTHILSHPRVPTTYSPLPAIKAPEPDSRIILIGALLVLSTRGLGRPPRHYPCRSRLPQPS